jgi:predicted nucleotidyltransferase
LYKIYPLLPIIYQIANEYKANLQNLYGNELAELVLFGSYARGDNQTESDIDFAIVFRNPNTRPAAEIAKTSVISSRLSLKYGFMLSSLSTSLHKKQTSMQGIYQEIRKEGIVI